MKLIEKVIPAANAKHSATVIFFHGSGECRSFHCFHPSLPKFSCLIFINSGDTGNNLIEWVKFLLGRHFSIPHVKFIYPTAPVQPYTPLNNELSNVWFDRRAITIQAQENRRSLASIYETVNEMIDRETKFSNIPESRVIVGGFSMGGCLAMHTGYHLNTNLAGVFACSAFLNEGTIVYDSLDQKKSSELPKLKMFHGGR